MAFRAFTAADVPDLASLIVSSGQPHVFLYTPQNLLEMLNPDHPNPCFVWDEAGIQGAYFVNWKPELVSIPETTNFCFLERMFWHASHSFDFAHRFLLFSAQFEATLRGFDDLILPVLFAPGGPQPYLALGGEEVQFYGLEGAPHRRGGIRFHLL